jgi:heme exporter protein B
VSWTLVAAKDIRVELRARETLVPVLLIGFVVITLAFLAFHDVAERRAVAAGTVWLALAFASGVGMARAFGAEKDRGTLDVLLGLPIARGHVYLGKTAATFAMLLVVALITVPAYLLVSGESVPAAGWAALALFLVLGTLGLATTGTMLSVLTAQTRSRDVLLPVLLFPLLVPLLALWRAKALLLAGYDIAFLAASWLLFDQAVGE